MRPTKKRRIALAAALAVAVSGGVAYAYWTTTGSGTATATVASDVALTVAQQGSVTGLYPGGPDQSISFKITNPNPGAEQVTGAVVAITGTTNVGCTAADFTITQPTFATQQIAGGGTLTVSTAAIRMDNTTSNQNACKGVTVNMSISVS